MDRARGIRRGRGRYRTRKDLAGCW